ncbi:DUF167 domain-containing protein [Candidatus Hydrogenosomobacter endosymbioticus]|uniref:UPF0235 protein HYD_0230 n=1 Tax=Candidatus Hydrogenosomobacter endosymbioticus TaxID=2558174 RepID=A0ABM7V808_9PROT|nr:DUF167 domain-containing protein [Candidatus Hydrogenosomobacter endosymbioticus]BDB95890.1 hypothetical protein HYD_0230 [Candidatus Hydrogenosomobacter endosymbioticus]
MDGDYLHEIKSELSRTKIVRFRVRVSPKASRNTVLVESGQYGDKLVRVYVTAAPEDGKANKAVLNELSKFFEVPKSSVFIHKGEESRDKTIIISRI